MNDRDIVDVDAETVRYELCEGRLVALAVAVRPGEDFDRSHGVNPNLGRFPQANAGAERADRRRGCDPAGLPIGGQTYSAQLAVPGGRGLAFAKARIFGNLQCLVER